MATTDSRGCGRAVGALTSSKCRGSGGVRWIGCEALFLPVLHEMGDQTSKDGMRGIAPGSRLVTHVQKLPKVEISQSPIPKATGSLPHIHLDSSSYTHTRHGQHTFRPTWLTLKAHPRGRRSWPGHRRDCPTSYDSEQCCAWSWTYEPSRTCRCRFELERDILASGRCVVVQLDGETSESPPAYAFSSSAYIPTILQSHFTIR